MTSGRFIELWYFELKRQGVLSEGIRRTPEGCDIGCNAYDVDLPSSVRYQSNGDTLDPIA